MALRSGSGEVVAFVASLINDVANDTFTPEQIQDALDRYRWEARYLQLDALPTKASGGTTTYVTFITPSEDWRYFETDLTLYDSNYDELTPATSDATLGRWTLSAEPTRPVYVSGYSHDPYAAAADLLEVRGSQLAEDIQSFSVHNGSFTYATKRSGPLELARHYRNKSRSSVKQSIMYRTDVNIYDQRND